MMGRFDGGGQLRCPDCMARRSRFNGGWLTVLHSASLSFAPGNAMSFELWAKRTQSGYPGVLLWQTRGMRRLQLSVSLGPDFRRLLYDPPVGEWRHFVWVFTGTEWLGYVNGIPVYQVQGSLGAENLAASLLIGSSGTCGQPFRRTD